MALSIALLLQSKYKDCIARWLGKSNPYKTEKKKFHSLTSFNKKQSIWNYDFQQREIGSFHYTQIEINKLVWIMQIESIWENK